MANGGSDQLPEDLNLNLNTHVNQFMNDEDLQSNPIALLNINSPYCDIENLANNFTFINYSINSHEYCSLH